MKIKEAINGFIIDMKASGYSPSTVELYKYVMKNLSDFLMDMDVKDIKPNDLSRFMVYLREDYIPSRLNESIEPVSASTLQKHVNGIKAFFKWAEKELDLKKRPDMNLKRITVNPKVIIPFTEDDVKRLVKATQSSDVTRGNQRYTAHRRTWRRDAAIVLVLLDTGLRIGELCRLNVSDIDQEKGDIYVAPFSNSNKKTHSRIVHIGRSAKRAVWLYLTNRKTEDEDAPLFTDERNRRRITTNSVRCLLKDLGTTAGVDDVHPHRFRHTFCIEFLRNDGDVFSLQQLTGHTSLDMLKNYLHIAKGDTARAHRRASPADHWDL